LRKDQLKRELELVEKVIIPQIGRGGKFIRELTEKERIGEM